MNMNMIQERVRIIRNSSDRIHGSLILQDFGYDKFSLNNSHRIGWHFTDFYNSVLLHNVRFGINNDGQIYAEGKCLAKVNTKSEILKLAAAFHRNCDRHTLVDLDITANLNLKPEYLLFIYDAVYGYNLFSNTTIV